LNFPFVDLDDFLVKMEGLSIPQIFAEKGEAYFREAEKKSLHLTLQKKPLVLATGGGTPCFFDNLNFIKARGLSIYLKVPLPILCERLLKDQKEPRPLYRQSSEEALHKKLLKTLEVREKYYFQAHLLFLNH
ncbi:MAG: shikimate kinase, partial [Bacteroidota bacterium]